MKKLLSLFLATLMLLSLSACKKTTNTYVNSPIPTIPTAAPIPTIAPVKVESGFTRLKNYIRQNGPIEDHFPGSNANEYYSVAIGYEEDFDVIMIFLGEAEKKGSSVELKDGSSLTAITLDESKYADVEVYIPLSVTYSVSGRMDKGSASSSGVRLQNMEVSGTTPGESTYDSIVELSSAYTSLALVLSQVMLNEADTGITMDDLGFTQF